MWGLLGFALFFIVVGVIWWRLTKSTKPLPPDEQPSEFPTDGDPLH